MRGDGPTAHQDANGRNGGASESAAGKRTLTEQLQARAEPSSAAGPGKRTLVKAPSAEAGSAKPRPAGLTTGHCGSWHPKG
jgi:hypothetical protein